MLVLAAPCADCESRPRADGKSYCEPCRTTRRSNAAVCAGGCGKRIAGTSTSLPAGERRCRPCRATTKAAALAARPARGPIGCGHIPCQRTIERPTTRQMYCDRRCGDAARTSSDLTRARYRRKNQRRVEVGGRTGKGWRLLRAQVLAEESDCWICGDEIDPALPGTHAMGGAGDHVVPLEGGGAPLDRVNVRAAHRICNQRRHIEWRRGRRHARREAA